MVVAGGRSPDPAVRWHLPALPVAVVAADSGLDHARALGLRVDVVVGDLDSISPDGLAWARAADGVEVEAHPTAKDQTDLELALRRAVDLGADQVVVVAGDGGRFDHTLAAALSLVEPALAGIGVIAWFGEACVVPVLPTRPLSIEGPAGQLLSLLPVGGPALGVRTEGLRWPLLGETLGLGTSRGVSNELVGGPATVALDAGVLLSIRPEALDQLDV